MTMQITRPVCENASVSAAFPAIETPVDQMTIDEMFAEHQAIYHQAGEVSQERLDRMNVLHGAILAAEPVTSCDLAQQLMVHHADGDSPPYSFHSRARLLGGHTS